MRADQIQRVSVVGVLGPVGPEFDDTAVDHAGGGAQRARLLLIAEAHRVEARERGAQGDAARVGFVGTVSQRRACSGKIAAGGEAPRARPCRFGGDEFDVCARHRVHFRDCGARTVGVVSVCTGDRET